MQEWSGHPGRTSKRSIYLSATATREIRPLLLEQKRKQPAAPPSDSLSPKVKGSLAKLRGVQAATPGGEWSVKSQVSAQTNIIRRTVRTYSTSTSSALAATSAVSWAPAPPQHQAGYPVEKPQEKVKVEGEKVKFGEQEKVPGATA